MGRLRVTRISGGGGGGGLVLSADQLALHHVENIVLHDDTIVNFVIPFTDVTSSEPWAKDDGSGNLELYSGLYAHYCSIVFTTNSADCTFTFNFFDSANDTIGVFEVIHVPANTHPLLIITGINILPFASTMQISLTSSCTVDPSFTISQIIIYTSKIA